MRRAAVVVCLCAATVTGAGVSAAEPADWTVARDAFDKTVVARWKTILAKNPYDRALAELVAIYRKSRTLAQLVDEYRREPETWATLVVQARLAELDKRPALSLYKLAVEHNERDARGWIAIGDASKSADARVAYERALLLSPPLPLQKAVLRKLAALPGDATTSDRAYARLIELDPKNGRLWVERADALALAGMLAPAIDSYTAAEPLLRTDPERRLYAIAQRGRAHELLGNGDAAIDDYNRAIVESPRGYFLRPELIARIITIHTKAGTLPALLDEYQRKWPEPSRRHFEWATLAQLHEATGASTAAITALQKAVAIAPAELASQRRLIKLLEVAGRHDDALTQLETAARAAPRDVPIQFELAQRYWGKHQGKLFATLDKLSRTFPNQIGVHHEVGGYYMKLRRVDLAIREYEIVAKLEPDPDNLLLLGDAYWAAGKEKQATTTWHRIARAGTTKAYAMLGNVLLEHELFEDALTAYSKAIAREPENPELWRARGAVYEAGERWTSALADTDHAVALLGTAPFDVGHAARYQLVRILATMRNDETTDYDVDGRVYEWQRRMLIDGDLIAGYLLAEYFGRSPDEDLVGVLEQLHTAVPTDDGITLELIRAYRVMLDYDKAIALAQKLARTTPARKEEMTKLIAKIEDDQRTRPTPMSWEDDTIDDPEPEVRAARKRARPVDRIKEARVRAGLRIGVGAGLRGAGSRSLTMGAIGTFGRGPLVLITRVDWAQRESEMRSMSALASSVGVAGRVLTRPSYALLLGGAQRFERRFGTLMTDTDRNGLAVDVTLDLVTRHWPLVVGARLEQGLFEQAQSSTLMFEMSVELR